MALDGEYLKEIEAARKELRQVLQSKKQFSPIILRLAFHDAGTYDAKAKTGGPNGSIRGELNNPANNGIKVAVDFCEQVKAKHPKVSYADLYQLAGIIAVEVTGGPIIPFVPGRQDARNQQDRGALPNPNGDAKHLRDVFHRMGLNDRDIVVLSGAHTLKLAKRRQTWTGEIPHRQSSVARPYFPSLRSTLC